MGNQLNLMTPYIPLIEFSIKKYEQTTERLKTMSSIKRAKSKAAKRKKKETDSVTKTLDTEFARAALECLDTVPATSVMSDGWRSQCPR